MDETLNLAVHLTKDDPSAELRIGVITAIDTGSAKKVRTDQTDLAWIARSQDAQLLVGDRVWMLRQGSTWLVGGRLSGIPSTPYVKRKNPIQTVTNSATAVNDTSLAVDLPVGAHRVQLFAHFSCPSAAADLRSQWAITGGGVMASQGRSCFGPGSASTAVDGSSTNSVARASGHNIGTAVIYGADAGLDASVLSEDILMLVTTAGTLQWQWAQGTATSGVTTTVSTASRVFVTPIQMI